MAIGHFLRNRPAVGATLAPVGLFIGMYGAQTSLQIMFQSYFQNARISGVIGMLSYIGLFLYAPFIGKIAAAMHSFFRKLAQGIGPSLWDWFAPPHWATTLL